MKELIGAYRFHKLLDEPVKTAGRTVSLHGLVAALELGNRSLSAQKIKEYVTFQDF
jgi:hypothetical protein